jgi:hypothetical protein
MRTLAILCAAITVCLGSPVAAQVQDAESGDEPTPKQLEKMTALGATRYKVFLRDDKDDQRRLEPRIVIHWRNTARPSETYLTGCEALWLDAGRPLAVLCCYTWDGRLSDDFQSLTDQKGTLVAENLEGEVVWRPAVAGVEFEALADGPVPGKTAEQRLRQMKSAARRFAATMTGWRSDDSDREELRLLPTPLYRYEVKEGELLDGAAFFFVQGTDPECLLLLEILRDEAKPRWRYAFGRLTSGSLEGRLDGQPVWESVKRYDSGAVGDELHRIPRSFAEVLPSLEAEVVDRPARE